MPDLQRKLRFRGVSERAVATFLTKSGVLAAVRTIQQTATETLPFTGIPIWLAVLFAGSILGAGPRAPAR